MKFKLTITFLIICWAKMLACSCAYEPDFQTQEDLEEYRFIAHVKVKGVEAATGIDEEWPIHKMNFELLELFKGAPIKEILVSGSHPSLEGWTSCDLVERADEEWIIFGYYDEHKKKLITGYCTRSKRIKRANGFEDLKYPNQPTLKKKLQQVFDKKINQPTYEGAHIVYYPNGTKQVEEHYENGVLNGKRLLYYPNETLQSIQQYSNGAKTGKFKWYSDKEQLTKTETFKNNIPVDTTLIWHEIDTSYMSLKIYSGLNNVAMEEAKSILAKPSLWIQRVFNEQGELLSNITYYQNGIKNDEHLYFPDQKKEHIRYYYKNGTLRSELYKENGLNTGVYKDWDEQGKLLRSWEYDEKGEVIEGSRKDY